MIWPFWRKGVISLGIDIGTSSIKVVQLEKKGNTIRLVTYGDLLRTNEENTDQASSKLLDEQVARMAKFLLKEAKVTSVQAALSLPIFSCFVTVIDMPNLSPQEISRAIPFEARQYVPVPLSEVSLDWTIVKQEQIAEAPFKKVKTQVLLVAIPNDIIQQYRKIAELANFSIAAMEMETFSTVRAVMGKEKGNMLIIDIGARSSGVSVVEEGTIRFAHSLEASGNDMTRAIMKGLNISWNRAEELKQEEGLEEKPARGRGVADLLHAVADLILDDVERVSHLYRDRTQQNINKAILTGGSARTPGLADYIVKRLGMEVSISNPFSQIEAAPELSKTLTDIGPSFTVAVGLALQAFEKAK